MVKWFYRGKPVPEETPSKDKFGFVYLITYTDGSKYIGKKQIWSETRMKPRLTDRKNAKRIKVSESKWREYEGSSKSTVGLTVRDKEILCFCDTKIKLTYEETASLFIHNAIRRDDFHNANILGKFYSGKV